MDITKFKNKRKSILELFESKSIDEKELDELNIILDELENENKRLHMENIKLSKKASVSDVLFNRNMEMAKENDDMKKQICDIKSKMYNIICDIRNSK